MYELNSDCANIIRIIFGFNIKKIRIWAIKTKKNAIREWIETIKYKKRMTQQDIAKELGVSKTYLSDVITGRSPYSDKLKQRLSELYSDCIYTVVMDSNSETSTGTCVLD